MMLSKDFEVNLLQLDVNHSLSPEQPKSFKVVVWSRHAALLFLALCYGTNGPGQPSFLRDLGTVYIWQVTSRTHDDCFDICLFLAIVIAFIYILLDPWVQTPFL